jgi:AraC-like DNA-binding protein/TolB-like protein
MTEPLSSDQIFIRKLTEIVLANLTNEKFGVKKLIQESGMSLYSLSRKLNSVNHKTINQFIREVRLHKARDILQKEALTVSEVAYRVGFNSPAYFNTCFHKFFGYPPGEVKKNDQESPEENMLNPDIKKHILNKPLHRTLVLKLILSLAVIVVIVGLFVFPGIFRRDTLESISSSGGRISLAVMPFQNLTNDTAWNLWRDAIQQSLISALSNTGELKVRQKEYINTLLQTQGLTDYGGISPTVAGTISKKIDADIFIYGSIQKAGSAIRVDAQLIDTKTKEVLKSFNVKGLSGGENAFQIVDTLSQRLRNFLLISKLINENPEYVHFPLPTTTPQAFRYCI